jgi:hypothetical protein
MAAQAKMEATKGRPEPAFRKPNQTRAGRHRQQMIADFVAALGGPNRVTALQMVEIERAASLTLLAQDMRAKALRGEAIDIGDMIRLEGAVSRVIRSLNLPAPGSAAPVPTLAEYLAQCTTDEPEAGDT